MSTEWSLKEIYPSLESEEFQRDFERFSNFREGIQRLNARR